jgi:hypothetical protein
LLFLFAGATNEEQVVLTFINANNSISIPFRDKRVEVPLRDKRVSIPFRDKRTKAGGN